MRLHTAVSFSSKSSVVTSQPLIDSPSDAGGVAARAGFSFQDHVGVGLLLDMLSDTAIVMVEFETADDITLRSVDDAGEINEYIQVKTTEGDGKWNLKEVTERTLRNGKPIEWSSLCEKSLACDRFSDRALFRIVTKRDVATNLKPFCVPRANRHTVEEKLRELVLSFGKKYKKSVSKKGRHLGDWAAGLFWHVASSSDALKNHSINRILRLFEGRGVFPSYSVADQIYEMLLKKVREASEASRALEPNLKSVCRQVLLDWWEAQVADIKSATHVTMKVYEILPEPFLIEMRRRADYHVKRSMKAYDVQFDDKVWRSTSLCDYLLDWLPEMALPSNVLANFNRFNARDLLPKALNALKGRSIDSKKLLAETLLHAIMRNHLNSEPIPCRLFNLDDGTATSAHIVFDVSGDQLWLGRPCLLPYADRNEILNRSSLK
ncbi:dsDNA nuclease domain-containing protein [Cereibacter sphaeroides]|uniref:dsDNA nuclease domain-containing protein n=1 Tax=Cereibacter sphaeroides TaxID=1063 RepID=UPI0009E4F189|nr:dsDNA nuclease domain-containing protein [Cereibacter sphaeroides]